MEIHFINQDRATPRKATKDERLFLVYAPKEKVNLVIKRLARLKTEVETEDTMYFAPAAVLVPPKKSIRYYIGEMNSEEEEPVTR